MVDRVILRNWRALYVKCWHYWLKLRNRKQFFDRISDRFIEFIDGLEETA